MSSPFVETFGGAEPCTSEKCEPFYIREWETMIVGSLIAMMLLYICGTCASSYFTAGNSIGSNTADSGSNRFGMRDDRAGQDNNAVFDYTADPNVVADMPQISRFAACSSTAPGGSCRLPQQQCVKGVCHTPVSRFDSQGPNVSKFMDFSVVDGIDSLKAGEPMPSHMPETSESALADVAGIPYDSSYMASQGTSR